MMIGTLALATLTTLKIATDSAKTFEFFTGVS
jgi:hypothetical protein